MDSTGSDKRYAFHTAAAMSSERLYIFENPIDLMSHASLEKICTGAWERDNRLSPAGIGPSIGACCFEVDAPVAEMFQNAYPFADGYISRREADGAKPEKYHIGLQKTNRSCMADAGIPR